MLRRAVTITEARCECAAWCLTNSWTAFRAYLAHPKTVWDDIFIVLCGILLLMLAFTDLKFRIIELATILKGTLEWAWFIPVTAWARHCHKDKR
jgi:hypothetical protein